MKNYCCVVHLECYCSGEFNGIMYCDGDIAIVSLIIPADSFLQALDLLEDFCIAADSFSFTIISVSRVFYE